MSINCVSEVRADGESMEDGEVGVDDEPKSKRILSFRIL